MIHPLRNPLGRMISVGPGAISAPKVKMVAEELSLNDQEMAKVFGVDTSKVTPMLLDNGQDDEFGVAAALAFDELNDIAGLLRSLTKQSALPWGEWLDSHDSVLDSTPRQLLFRAEGRDAIVRRLRDERRRLRGAG